MSSRRDIEVGDRITLEQCFVAALPRAYSALCRMNAGSRKPSITSVSRTGRDGLHDVVRADDP
jgi:hypothetical protein